jgi:hypothetical protein
MVQTKAVAAVVLAVLAALAAHLRVLDWPAMDSIAPKDAVGCPTQRPAVAHAANPRRLARADGHRTWCHALKFHFNELLNVE